MNFNVSINDFDEIITIVPLCIGDGNKVAFYSGSGLGTASVIRENSDISPPIYLETETLINILNKQNIIKIDSMKIDIEGSEYRILEELIEIQNSLCGLVIEFHDVDLHVEKIKNFIDKLQLTLTHIHPNNYGPVDKNNDPTVIEFTFEKQPIEISENCSLPNFLDQANNPLEKDIDLKFE